MQQMPIMIVHREKHRKIEGRLTLDIMFWCLMRLDA